MYCYFFFSCVYHVCVTLSRELVVVTFLTCFDIPSQFPLESQTSVSVNGGCVNYVVLAKIQWKPFWLATQLYSQDGWAGWQNGVNNGICTLAPSSVFVYLRIC